MKVHRLKKMHLTLLKPSLENNPPPRLDSQTIRNVTLLSSILASPAVPLVNVVPRQLSLVLCRCLRSSVLLPRDGPRFRPIPGRQEAADGARDDGRRRRPRDGLSGLLCRCGAQRAGAPAAPRGGGPPLCRGRLPHRRGGAARQFGRSGASRLFSWRPCWRRVAEFRYTASDAECGHNGSSS